MNRQPRADVALAEAVEANLFELHRLAARLPGGIVEENERFSRHVAFPENAMFRGVWRTRMHESEYDAAIDEQLAYFQGRGERSFYWWSREEPSPLGERLMARGFKPYYTNSPGMAAEMNGLEWRRYAAIGARLATPDDDDAFVRVFCEAYGAQPSSPRAWLAAHRAFPAPKPWTIWLAPAEGEPAAIAIGFAAAGVLGLYCIGTLPAARGRGLGAAVTLAACRAGRDAGLGHAVLFASPEGLPLYERIGFRVVPILVSRYVFGAIT